MDRYHNPISGYSFLVSKMRECKLDYQLFDPNYKPESQITKSQKTSKDTGLFVAIGVLFILIVIWEMIK